MGHKTRKFTFLLSSFPHRQQMRGVDWASHFTKLSLIPHFSVRVCAHAHVFHAIKKGGCRDDVTLISEPCPSDP